MLIGPLKAEQYDYLRSVSFYVNADKLALLVTGASYFSGPGDPLMHDIAIPLLRDLQEISNDDAEKVGRLSAERVCSPDSARPIGFGEYLALVRATYAA